MKTIAKVLESMLAKDATQQWTVRSQSASGATSVWTWGGYTDDASSVWTWGG